MLLIGGLTFNQDGSDHEIHSAPSLAQKNEVCIAESDLTTIFDYSPFYLKTLRKKLITE